METNVNLDVQDHRNLREWSLAGNSTDFKHLPIDMRFNDGHTLSIVVYSVLMLFSAIGNTTVLVLITRRRRTSPSRINTMLMHLAIADLLVTFLMMPLEIGWAATVSWKAGDTMCRITAFFRAFGLYLSSFILVCISIDRYYAVLKPLNLTGIGKRGKWMLLMAWIGATICSTPQSIIFHVEPHPNITWYEQCISYNVFQTYTQELSYSVFGMLMMYAFPLIIIIFSYASIILEIYKRSKDNIFGDRIRRSSLGFLGRARIRTLKMTVIIVFVFFVCWTPYYVMCVWYWYDRSTAIHVDQRIQRGLFLFACTNSCMNPIVYGLFNIRARRTGGGGGCGRGGGGSGGVLGGCVGGGQATPSLRKTLTTTYNKQQQQQHRQQKTNDIVCLMSWRRNNDVQETLPRDELLLNRRNVCLSCGESFESGGNVTSEM